MMDPLNLLKTGFNRILSVWDLGLMMCLSATILAMLFYMLIPQPILSMEIIGRSEPRDLSLERYTDTDSNIEPSPLALLESPSQSKASSLVRLHINLNRASLTELEQLPGIGPKMARRIIQHRQKNGPFQTIKDLLNVRGIGPKSFSKLQAYLAI